MKRDVILFNWRNSDDISIASRYSKVLIDTLFELDYKVSEVYLRTTDYDGEVDHDRYGPFDFSHDDSVTKFSKRKIENKFNGFCKHNYGIFVNKILIITDFRMLPFITTFMYKECAIVFVSASNHMLLNNIDLVDKAKSELFFKLNINATITGNIDDYNLHRILFDGERTNNMFAKFTYDELGEVQPLENKKYILFYGNWKLDINSAKISQIASSLGCKAVIISNGTKYRDERIKSTYDNITWLSSAEDISEYYDEAILFYSLESHNLSQPMIDAMAHGVPTLLTTKTFYNKKVIGELGELGFFVDPDIGFKEWQLRHLKDPELYGLLSDRCFKHIKKKFDKKSFIDNLSIVLRRLK